jgi:trehalose 2-sulfotransferase
MVPRRSFLICASPRSGSGLLAGVLRSSGVAGRPEEYFWRGDTPSWRERWGVQTDAEYLAAALEAGTTVNGVFGARVMWAYVNDVPALVTRATGAEGRRSAVIMSAFPDLRLVLLRRRDRVTQAVSWAKAEQTGVWYEGDVRRPQRRAAFDANLIDRLLVAVEEAELGWSSFANETGVDTLEMTYEGLAEDPSVVLSIGADPEIVQPMVSRPCPGSRPRSGPVASINGLMGPAKPNSPISTPAPKLNSKPPLA